MAQKHGNARITEVHFCIYAFYIYSCDSQKMTENIFFFLFQFQLYQSAAIQSRSQSDSSGRVVSLTSRWQHYYVANP